MTTLRTNAARLATAALVAAGMLGSTAAQAYDRYDRRVYVVNDGYGSIYSVYMTHIDSSSWGRDLLGRSVIYTGDWMVVQPDRPQGYCRFDIKITYTSGAELVLWDVNICGGRELVANEWNLRVYNI